VLQGLGVVDDEYLHLQVSLAEKGYRCRKIEVTKNQSTVVLAVPVDCIRDLRTLGDVDNERMRRCRRGLFQVSGPAYLSPEPFCVDRGYATIRE